MLNNKRKSLKKVAGIGAVATVVPSSWIKPIISSVVLPAHAQTSGVIDTTAPEIVVDTTPITLTVGDTLTAPTATCTDDTDTSCEVVVDVSNVDTSTAGSYEIIYTATDSAGNVTEVTVAVIVEAIPMPVVSVTVTGTPTVSEVITDTGLTVVASLGSVIGNLVIMLSVENGSLSKMEIESVPGQVISEHVDVFDLQGGLFGQYSIDITWL